MRVRVGATKERRKEGKKERRKEGKKVSERPSMPAAQGANPAYVPACCKQRAVTN